MEFTFYEEELPIVNAISQAAQELGYPAFVVGGFVRDRLINRPTKDLDVVCVGDGIKLAKRVGEILKASRQVVVFKRFGTAMLKLDEIELEFVGARKESYSRNSRKPEVEPGTIEDDQNRRDFTINAMAISLNDKDFGTLIDPFDGVGDIGRRLIKTPLAPGKTFSDDPLRMMRAVRFAAQLDYDIDEVTLSGIKENSHRLEIISMERIMTELNKIIVSATPSKGIDILSETGLLQHFLPEFEKLRGVEIINNIGHKDNYYHTLQVLDNLAMETEDLWLRWAAILHDIAKPPTKRFDKERGWTFHGHEVVGARWVPKIFKRLKLPLDNKMRYVQKLVRLHLRPISLTKEEITDSAIRRLLFDAGDDIDDLMMLCKADITSKNDAKVKRIKENYEKVKIKLREVEEKDQIRNWQPPITGQIIMDTFQLNPSREVGIIKDSIREAILDGLITNDYDAAFDFMLAEAAKLGLQAVEKSK
jgi:putative nucleotidyltransferase with HDIG domain